ncbi:MAG: hypothetical protein PF486_01230 [Prolixibacteraceae bacterium]|jgi:hypothetical protein|nr:hypothetical protein [Prolixibacteraceae bacterium]
MESSNHKLYNKKKSLLLLAVFNVSIFLIVGYITEWHSSPKPIENFLFPEIRLRQNRLTFLLLIPFISSAIWITVVNGKKRFFKTLLALALLFIPFSIIAILISYIAYTFSMFIGLDEWNNSVLEVLIFYLLFIVFTTLWNWIIAKLQKVKLNMKSILILAISQFAMPLICFIWCAGLSIFLDNDFIENAFFNGGVILAITLYEGFYLMWLKQQQIKAV